MLDTPARALMLADDDTLCALIRSARRRVVYMAPACSKAVAEAVGKVWQQLGPDAVTVILDADPEVYRLGFGSFAALGRLQDFATEVGGLIARQPGVRLGLLIADNQTLVWAPVAEMVEAGAKDTRAANAIRLGLPPADVERDLGAGPDGQAARSIGLDPVERDEVERVSQDLKDNPPQRFDVCRQMRVFNAYFEFVEIKLHGAHIERRTVTLPADLMGIADKPTQKKLRATFRLIEQEDGLTGQQLLDDRKQLEKRHLRRIVGQSWVIKRKDKPALMKDVRNLRAGIEEFQNELSEQLTAQIDASRAKLHAALLPSVKKSPPRRWARSSLFRGNQDLSASLDRDLAVAFGRAENAIHPIKLDVTFKAVTYESLQDPEFMAAARCAFPELTELFDESDVAPPLPLTQGDS